MLRRSSSRLLSQLAAGARCHGCLAAVAEALPTASTSYDTSSIASSHSPHRHAILTPSLGSTALYGLQQRNSFFSWGRKASSGVVADDAAPVADASTPLEVGSAPDLPADPTPTDILQQASDIIDASAVAEMAAFTAAHFDRWWNVSSFMDMLGWLHYSVGLQWWAAIVLVNLVVRGISMPLTIYMQRKTKVSTELKEATERARKLYMEAAKAGSPEHYEELTSRARKEYEAMTRRFTPGEMRTQMLLPFLGLANLLLMGTQFVAINGLVGEALPSLTNGGVYWFTDLTSPDKYLALPIMCTVASYWHLTSGGMQLEMGNSQMNTKQMMTFMKMGTAMFIPMGAFMPAALPLLWSMNTMVGIAQAQLFRRPAIRSWLQLPPLPAKPAVPAAMLSPEQGAAAEAAAVAAARTAALKPPPPGQGPFRALHKPNFKPGSRKPAQYIKPDRAAT